MSASRLQHYIYKITNKTTGEYYIGKRTCLDWRTDDYMGSGTLLNRKMEAHPDHEWIKEVLLLLSSEEQAYEYEAVAVGDRWRDDPLCLNLIAGGAGGGLSKADIEEREQRMAGWLDGEKLPEVIAFDMSNDETKTRVTVTNNTDVCKEIVRDLIEQGYYFGSVSAYKKTTLSDLGLSNTYTSAETASLISSGVFPDISVIGLTNHEFQVFTIVRNSKKAMFIVNNLLREGWVVGRCNTYRRVSLLEASRFCAFRETVRNDHESQYLKGLPCQTNLVNMSSPCKTKYLTIACKKNQPYPQRVKELYDLGWAFGYKSNMTRVKSSSIR